MVFCMFFPKLYTSVVIVSIKMDTNELKEMIVNYYTYFKDLY